MEGVAGMDAFVASTGNDETNLLTSLLAKTVGARKVVTLIDDFSYLQLIPRLDIDASVSPRLSTVNAILRDVRGERITSVATLKRHRRRSDRVHCSGGIEDRRYTTA